MDVLSEAKNNNREEEKKKIDAQNADCFRRLAGASLLYAVIYTICVFRNMEGIAVAFWTAAAVIYVRRAVRLSGTAPDWKKGSIFQAVIIVLLGISTFLTDNIYVILMNYMGIFLMLVSLVLHNFRNDVSWDFGRYVTEILLAVVGAMSYIGMPFIDWSAFRRQTKGARSEKSRNIMLGILASIPCILIIGFLLVSADMVFEKMVASVLKNIRLPRCFFGVMFTLCFGFLSSYCAVRYLGKTEPEKEMSWKRAQPLTAMIVCGSIAAMYFVFCVIQVLYLFIGKMELPAGITYAQYARKGFFQLLFICLMNLILVLCMKKYVCEHKILNGMLLFISSCTYIMIASSAYRMILYIAVYHLTFLRIFVLVALTALAFLMAGVIRTIVKPDFPMFRYGMAVVSVIYMLFSFSHVDYFIASYNLAQAEAGGTAEDHVDYRYLTGLSTDAAPAIARYVRENPRLLEEEKIADDLWEITSWYQEYKMIHGGRYEEDGIRKFNVSHAVAGKLLQ